MVRLVFRPYTQVRRTICTSVPLRASTRVSSGFALLRHSSPSFGSQQACSHSNLSQKIMVGRWCSPLGHPTSQVPCASRVCHPPARTHVRLLGPCFKTGGWRALRQRPGARRSEGTPEAHAAEPRSRRRRHPTGLTTPGLWPPPPVRHRSTPRVDAADRRKPFHVRPGRTPGLHSLPSQQFQALFDSLFKVLFIFPSRYLFAIGLPPVFSLRWDLPPALGCIPKQPDSAKAPRGAAGSAPTGFSPSPTPLPGDLGPVRRRGRFSRLQFGQHETARFSSWALPGSLAVTRGILVSFFSSAY